MVTAYSPRLSVVVRKRVERRGGVSGRISGRSRIIDLTPMLGDSGSVQTTKDIHSLAGTFAITVPDRPDRGGGGVVDSLYGLVEPMDYVEIRMARSPEQYAGSGYADGLPIVMRGFVDAVSRSESLNGGEPRRSLTITGHDYGKIPQIANLLPLASYATNQDYQTEFPVFQELGLNPAGMPANEFVRKIVDGVLNDFLRRMKEVSGFSDSGPIRVPVLAMQLSVNNACVAPYGALPPEFRVMDYLDQWCDLDWNELFVDDPPEGSPTVIYRPRPYLTLDGKPIQGGTVPIARDARGRALVVSDLEVLQARLERTDHDVANFFWVQAPRSFLADARVLSYNAYSASPGSQPLEDRSPNCDTAIYGLRPMQRATQQASIALIGRRPSDETEAPRLGYEQDINEWMSRRRETLAALNRDNAIFENGSLTLMGNERIRPGQYFETQRGELRARYYAHAVSHTFAPFRSFTTTVQVERGTGFYERTKLDRGPAFAEGAPGVY